MKLFFRLFKRKFRKTKNQVCRYTVVTKLKKYEDTRFKNFGDLMRRILNEDDRQIKKWGIQKRTLFEWFGYAMEEAGETIQAISEFTYRGAGEYDIVKEAIEAATLLLKIADMILEELES